jgi:hypothetical protein
MVENPRLLFPPALLQLSDQARHVSLVPVTLALNVLNKAEEINSVQPSVADPERDVYPGSEFFPSRVQGQKDFRIPDPDPHPHQRMFIPDPDPGSGS